ncbi:MAG: radical SAM protein [Bacteroidales bacterium]
MQLSRFNILSEIKDSEKCYIINPLYGTADIIDKDYYRALLEGKLCNNELIEKGYLSDPDAERSEFRKAYLKFTDERDSDEIQLFFVPGYSCNFNCSYCYQADYNEKPAGLSPEVIKAFYSYIDSEFKGRSKYITLFGGEPLLPGKNHKANILHLVEMATERAIDIAVVTNGYHISGYIDIFKKASIREVQVTIDGTREVHDSRRKLKSSEGTFDRIVEGIDLLLENDIPVNLRVVIDRDNISDLPALARFAIDKGWTDNSLFKTQLGRNYELHECRHSNTNLFSRIEMYRELYDLIMKFPHILDFHKPSFSVAKYLSENGVLPPPLFDACPGTKTEWAFDFTGNIYACTATVGKTGEELGSFFPERVLKDEIIEKISERDILSIKECGDCNVSLLCGGGCAAVAKSRNGSGNSADCRPIKELLELGIAAYFRDQL